ncbi:MAG TPA: hypothetical protein V6D27_17900, partial [Vampirovibrionales bacterium]
SDREHPCQALADIMTVGECFGQLEDVTLTYLGDGNNVAHSLLLAGAMVGMNIRIATPAQFEPAAEIVEQAKKIAQGKSEILITHDPIQAVKGAQVLYTDVWASMGQEEEARTRIPLFQPYQVNEELFNHADGSAIILHCLPAHRGEEITDGAIEGTASRVWDQAENRMHAQKALLASVLGAI